MSLGTGPIEHVVVVGGGSSGWLSAAYLTRMFGRETAQRMRISLVESQDIGIIGVGEATIPSLRGTLHKMEIPEREFMVKSNGTFKLGIKFQNWRVSKEEDPNDVFMNPFGSLPLAYDIEAASYWLKDHYVDSGGNFPDPFANSFTMQLALCDAFKAPKGRGTQDYQRIAGYAYHMDAILFGRYLREVATARGVHHCVDNVTEVVRDENGYIDHLKLEKHGSIKGDLYLDCTGFRSLLLQHALGESFISYGDSLLCDRAVAIPVPWPGEPTELTNYTMATALDAGWSWDIPLYSRQGRGYVYSSRHAAPDDAETEFRRFIGDEEGKHPARHLKMKVGRAQRFWVKNCIAVGLSGGFIEPLESTGIYMVEAGMRELSQYFPDRSFHPLLQRRYNEDMAETYDTTRDFIVFHYMNTQREDTPFWRDNKMALVIPDSLQELLDLWKHKVPSSYDFASKVFSHNHYTYIMAGLQAWPKQACPNFPLLEDRYGKAAFEYVRRLERKALEELPDHYQFIKWLHDSYAADQEEAKPATFDTMPAPQPELTFTDISHTHAPPARS